MAVCGGVHMEALFNATRQCLHKTGDYKPTPRPSLLPPQCVNYLFLKTTRFDALFTFTETPFENA